VQFLAAQAEIEDMLAKGYSVQMVYEHLQEQGRCACSYSTFCDYARGKGKRMHSSKKAGTPPTPATKGTDLFFGLFGDADGIL
jgi:hypothetical protein